MNNDLPSNGHVASSKNTEDLKKCSHLSNKSKVNANGTIYPIPNQKTNKRWSTNLTHNHNDSAHCQLPSADDTSPVTAFSRSFGGSHAASSLNVYSMSPRSTSIMYHYYKQPKGFYENQSPLIHGSRNSIQYCAETHTAGGSHKDFMKTINDSYGSPPKSPFQARRGAHPNIFNDMTEDELRRRAWSESDSNRKSNMHSSRMSALKKIRMKLGGSGNMKKKKDDELHNDSPEQTSFHLNTVEIVNEKQHQHTPASPKLRSSSGICDDELSPLASPSLNSDQASLKIPSEVTPIKGNSPSDLNRTSGVFEESTSSQDSDLIYQRFLEEHTCYDIMPTSCKLVVFDTQLQAKKAFHALIENSARSAPLWDASVSCHVGMLTVTDFIKVILIAHRDPNMKVESIENETINTWRKLLNQQSSFASIDPDDSLLHSLKILMSEHFHGVPVMDETTGDIFHVINHKRILRFLHLFINELPQPDCLNKTLADVRIGTYTNVATVKRKDSLLHVLSLIIEKKVSAIPVVDEDEEVLDVFCKLDMISLAAQGLYHDLSTTVEVALANRFKPLFEDEGCPADAFTRFSSPKPQRRDMNIRRNFRDQYDVTSSDDRRRHNELHHQNQHQQVYSLKKGHYVSHSHSDNHSSPQQSNNGEKRRPHSGHLHPGHNDMLHECTGHKIRHKSLSNPLVKCKMTCTIKQIIDLMVNTEANLLVVVGQSSNHVIGVVTVSDVLYFIVNPTGREIEESSPSRIQRRSRHQFCSTSSKANSLSTGYEKSDASSIESFSSICSQGMGTPGLSSSSVQESGFVNPVIQRNVIVSNL